MVGTAALVCANFDIQITPKFLGVKQNPTAETTPASGSAAPVQSSHPSSPSATPVPIDKSLIKIEVLNGTVSPGVAGTLSTKLKAVGFSIVKTGNGASQDNTVINYPTGQIDQANMILAEVIKYYAAAHIQEDPSITDFQVIIGNK